MSQFCGFFVFTVLLNPSIGGLPNKYQVVAQQTLNFTTAENYCMDTFSTHLASIHNEDDMNQAQLLCAEPCWIGLHETGNTYNWTDGSYFDYPSISSINKSTMLQNCGHLSANSNVISIDSGCDLNQHFLCNIPSIFCPEKGNWDIIGDGNINMTELNDKCALRLVADSGCGVATRRQMGNNINLRDIVVEMSFDYELLSTAPAAGLAIKYNADDYLFIKISKTITDVLFISRCSVPCTDDVILTNFIRVIMYQGFQNILRVNIYNNKMNISINNKLVNELTNYPTNFSENGSIGITACNVDMMVSSLYISTVDEPATTIPTTTDTVTNIPSNTIRSYDYEISVNITFMYHAVNNTNLLEIIKIIKNITQIVLTGYNDCVDNYKSMVVENVTNDMSMSIKIAILINACNQTVQQILITEYEQNLQNKLVQQTNDNTMLVTTGNNFKIMIDEHSTPNIMMETTKMMTDTTMNYVSTRSSLFDKPGMMELCVAGAIVFLCLVLICCLIIDKCKKKKNKYKAKDKSTQNEMEFARSISAINNYKKSANLQIPVVMVNDNSSDEEANVFVHTNKQNHRSGNIGRGPYVVNDNEEETEENNM